MADNHPNVAIVDDDLAVLDSLKFLLEVVGLTVRTYASAAAFLEDRTARPACLILDQHMPQMTGLELAAQLRTDGLGIPVLLFSAQLSPAILARAAQLGIEKVLVKPPLEDELLGFVDAHK
jgi:two-component system, LuxR family, response regulator FixJ